jgi:prepilin-type N-terminal cleavage/methylation domain-containing protein
MLNKINRLKKGKPESGFTIIEIMIVLVIAGLILLIVFLAVPALQRSARNTQRKNDVSALASGLNDFVTDNNGVLPTTVTVASGGQTTITGGSGTTSVSNVKMGYYTVGSVTIVPFASAPAYGLAPSSSPLGNLLFAPANAAAPAATVGPDSIYVVTSATCSNNAVASSSSRAFAVMYELEQSGSRIIR